VIYAGIASVAGMCMYVEYIAM